MSVVMFSGGCDSSLLLYEEAMKISRKEVCYSTVVAVSVCHDQIRHSSVQRESRVRFLDEMRRRELDRHIQCVEVDITQRGGSVTVSGLVQPSIWFSLAPLYAGAEDTVLLGYHDGDQFWQYRHEAEAALHGLSALLNKKLVASYPLRLTSKADIIKTLKDRGLYDLCWYCENPVGWSVCGTCDPCKTHRTALWQLSEFGGYSKCLLADEAKVKSAEDHSCVKASQKLPGS